MRKVKILITLSRKRMYWHPDRTLAVYFSILLVMLIILPFSVKVSGYNLPIPEDRFNHLTARSGLSQSSVFCLAQDEKGFIWMGTKNGLARFDGYDFVTYRYDPKKINSLSNNEITSLLVDSSNYLWIGTRGGGLNLMDRGNGTFRSFDNLSYDNIIRAIFKDRENNIWVGTSEGLIRFTRDAKGGFLHNNVTTESSFFSNGHVPLQRSNRSVTVISINQTQDGQILVGTENGLFFYNPLKKEFVMEGQSNNDYHLITSVIIDKSGIIWAGAYGGLIKLTPSGNNGTYSLVQFNIDQPLGRKMPVDRVESITEDSAGNIWAATFGGGLVKIKGETIIGVYRQNSNITGSLPDDIVNALMIDKTGMLWIGTESQGCSTLDLSAKKFINPGHISDEFSSLNRNLVTALSGYEGSLWVGTAGDGIFCLQFQNGRVEGINHTQWIPTSLINNREILSLMNDCDGDLWIGTTTNSLTCYSKKTGYRNYIVDGFVFALHQDREGRIWYGAWGQGLGYIDKKTGRIVRFSNATNQTAGPSSDKILAIFDDNDGNLWIGTKGRGLNIVPLKKVREGTPEFTYILHSASVPGSLSYNDVNVITQDSKGNIWIGTGSGLNKVIWPEGIPRNEAVRRGNISFETYHEKEGLPNNVIYGIREDVQGRLWLSTNNGLAMLNPVNGQFRIYEQEDGLPSTDLHFNAHYRSDDGLLFFGGAKGLTYFDPATIIDNEDKPNTLITNLKISGKRVVPGEKYHNKVILGKDIPYAKEIILTYREKEITLDFSALYYVNPQKIKYAYRLIGFNDSWQETSSNNRSATYTNLDAGNYIFQVKATNNDGIWNEKPTELAITVLPPFWLTPFFYLLYFAIIVLALMTFRQYSLIAVKEKNKLIIENLEHHKQTEIAEAKMLFFTNVSHEIRTPLTLINDPLEQILEYGSVDDDSRRHLLTMSRNAKRLLNMINQLLLFRKIDLGYLKLQVSEIDVYSFLKEIATHFEPQFRFKKIDFNILPKNCTELIWFSKEHFATIIYNLLTNAVKFTPEGGRITITVEKQKETENKNGWQIFQNIRKVPKSWISITVTDNGPGISASELQNIFKRFYQSDEHMPSQRVGSGIGLSIVKDLVELHGGTVKVESIRGSGSAFTICIKSGNRHFQKLQLVNNDKSEAIPPSSYSELFNPDKAFGQGISLKIGSSDFKKPVLLLVEDDPEMVGYLESNFSKQYKTFKALDGKKGFELAVELMPDLIISDVMMPEMNGIELCKKLKSTIETSHIPVILLTAHNEEEEILKGLDSGADCYFTKPFNIKIIEAQAASLIRARDIWREKFGKQMLLLTGEAAIAPLDGKFLKQLMDIVESHIIDTEFDVTFLVESMHMSHATILHKVKALTGLSMVELIRKFRLQKAASILKQERFTVSEAGYMVGFSDPKYFSKCFTKEFNQTPSEYINEHHPLIH